MRLGRGRGKRVEHSADAREPLNEKLQPLQQRHEDMLAALVEAQQEIADSGSARQELEEQLKVLERRREALRADAKKATEGDRKDVRELLTQLAAEIEATEVRYEQAMLNEKRLIEHEKAARKQLDEFAAQKAAIEEHMRQLRALTETD